MDTIRTILESRTGIAFGSASSIWISFVEWLPFWLRIGILLGTFIGIWYRLYLDFRKNK